MGDPQSDKDRTDGWRSIAWFIGLWLAGVLAVGTVAFLIRLVLLG